MVTLAQFMFISAYPDKSYESPDNEDFEQFRDVLLSAIPLEKVDGEYFDKTKKEEKLSGAAICRRSHKVIRRALERKKINLLNIQRFLLSRLYEISKDLEEVIDEELENDWSLQIQPHLQGKSSLIRFETLLGVFAKVLTLSEAGKTMVSYLKAGGKELSTENSFEDEADSSFKIPK